MTIWNPNLDSLTGPRYKAIADRIEHDIKAGIITSGYQLPTHRDLADLLGVTVGTVTRGYAEAARRGLLRGETGRGTYIAGPSQDDTFLSHSEDTEKEAVDMGMSLPLYALDPNMAQTFQILGDQKDLQGTLHYYPSKGRYVDRETGSIWLKNHYLNVHPDDILITAGGQHAIATVLSAMFRPGDAIAVESVTYPLFKTLARRFHLKLVPIEMDDQGMIPGQLAGICERQKVRGIYCMPTCHNPTTARMSETRRQAIAEIAGTHDLFVIEDDAYSLLSDEVYTPIYNYAPERTFYIASLSKAVTSGLRFGYLVCPKTYNRRVEQTIADFMWMASPVSARIAKQWIEDGTALKTIDKKKQESIARNQLTQKILAQQAFQFQTTGYFIWLSLPEAWNATDFAQQANEQRVIVTPDQYFLVGRQHEWNQAVRIAISGPQGQSDLERGLNIVQQLLNDDYDAALQL